MADPAISPQTLLHLRQRLETIREARTQADKRMKASHERFNVFTTLLDAHDEVCLHTRFLHCLLDPKSCHDCNSLFLGLFFETLTELPCEDHDGGPVTLNLPTSKQLWTVEIEGPRDGVGRIDLLLKL